jgi:MAF protein
MSKIIAFVTTPGLVLASGSAYRKTLLERLGLRFEICPANVDETPRPGERPEPLAARLAREKAHAIAPRYPEHLIIGSDQTATLDGNTILGKPGNFENAREQLRRLSNATARYFTAICVLNSANMAERCALVTTEVDFRPLSERQIARYLKHDEPYDCTGSAKIERMGIALVRKVHSEDPSALIGLPLIALIDLLAAEGVDVLAS